MITLSALYALQGYIFLHFTYTHTSHSFTHSPTSIPFIKKKQTILCDTGVLHKCHLSERTYQLLDYYDRPSGRVHYASTSSTSSSQKQKDYGVFWPWAKKRKNSNTSSSNNNNNTIKWYYLDSNKTKRGPLSTNAIQDLLKSQYIKLDSYVWNTDMCTWKRACQVAPLQEVILRTQAARERETKYSRQQQRASSRAAAASAAKEKAMWYYLDHSRRQRGPVSTTTLISLVSRGALKKRTYVWRKGFSKWKPLNEVRELIPGGQTTSTRKTTTTTTSTTRRDLERKREQAAAARAAAAALERAKAEEERKRRQRELEEERRNRKAAQKRAEIERRKREREKEEEKRRQRARQERLAQIASSRAKSVAIAAATSAITASTSARAAATAVIMISSSQSSQNHHTSNDDTETKKQQQRDAWTAESKQTIKEEKWFYVDSKGSQRGPMSSSILKSLIDTNTVTSSTYVWKVSMKTWKRLRDVPSLLHRTNLSHVETKSSKVSEPLSSLDWNRRRRRSGEQQQQQQQQKKKSNAYIHKQHSTVKETKKEQKHWFYLNPSTRKREGPVSQRMLLKMISSSKITHRTYVWKSPMPSWKRIESVLDLSPTSSSSSRPIKETINKSPPDTSKWFCLIRKKQFGPMTTSELINMNPLENRTLVWQKGMQDWTPLRNVTSLFALFKDRSRYNSNIRKDSTGSSNVDRLAAIFDQAVKHMNETERSRLGGRV